MTRKKSLLQSWRNSLSHQLLLRFWLSLVIFFSLVGVIQYQTLYQFLMKGQTETLQAQFNVVNEDHFTLWLTHKELYPNALSDLSPGVLMAVFSQDGQLQKVIGRREQSKENLPHERNISALFEKNKLRKTPYIFTGNTGRYMLLAKPIYNNASGKNNVLLGYVLIGTTLKPVDDILSHQTFVYLLIALFVLILGGFTTGYLLQKPLKPLMNMSKVSEKIAKGQYDLRIPDQHAATEIEHLRHALNSMLATLEKALAIEKNAKEQMARFIADASHELRTPLTSIRGFLEILLRKDHHDVQTLESAHKTMLTEAERLIRLTEDLLTLNAIAEEAVQSQTPSHDPSQCPSQNSAFEPQAIPITPVHKVLPDVLPLLESLVSTRSLTVQADPIILPLKPDEFKQICYNLIHNAVQHTLNDGTIRISIAQDHDHISLSVTDNGEGIASKDLPHVFERFYRGARSRQKQRGKGAGLGLAIVWDIVQLRGGQINVKSDLGIGSTFEILFDVPPPSNH